MVRMTGSAIAILWAVLVASPAGAQSADVDVLRGTDRAAAAGGVEVLRGTPMAPRPPEERSYRTTLVLPFVAAGETLWLRDARSGRLVACQVRGSGYVGRSVIRCTQR